MKRLIFLLSFIALTASSFAQFTDTTQYFKYVRDTIKDRRPDKVTAAQLQKAFLGLSPFIATGYGVGPHLKLYDFADGKGAYYLGFTDTLFTSFNPEGNGATYRIANLGDFGFSSPIYDMGAYQLNRDQNELRLATLHNDGTAEVSFEAIPGQSANVSVSDNSGNGTLHRLAFNLQQFSTTYGGISSNMFLYPDSATIDKPFTFLSGAYFYSLPTTGATYYLGVDANNKTVKTAIPVMPPNYIATKSAGIIPFFSPSVSGQLTGSGSFLFDSTLSRLAINGSEAAAALTVRSATPGAANTVGAPGPADGAFYFQGGTGADNSYNSTGNGFGGNSGDVNIVTGNGGNETGAAATAGGGNGGIVWITGGNGGNNTVAATSTGTGGAGGWLKFASGNGGTAKAGTGVGATATGGNGGEVDIFTGKGGTATGGNGISGSKGGNGGTIKIFTGIAQGSGGNGGDVIMYTGNGFGTFAPNIGKGGNFYIYTSTTANNPGHVYLQETEGLAARTGSVLISSSALVGTEKLNVGGDIYATGKTTASYVNWATTLTPTGTADSQGATGDVRYDASFIYIKTAGGWMRSALASF